MARFVNSLQHFEKLGPPKLHSPQILWNDIQFAQQMNKAEVRQIAGEELDDEGSDQQVEYFDNINEVEVQGEVLPKEPLQCMSCGLDVVEDLAEVVDEITDALGSS